MKRTKKKLNLRRETLRKLDLAKVSGGLTSIIWCKKTPEPAPAPQPGGTINGDECHTGVGGLCPTEPGDGCPWPTVDP
jgi:hypothetical protein